jgi:hypothetical protein
MPYLSLFCLLSARFYLLYLLPGEIKNALQLRLTLVLEKCNGATGHSCWVAGERKKERDGEGEAGRGGEIKVGTDGRISLTTPVNGCCCRC